MEGVLASAMAMASQTDPQPTREKLLEFVVNARKHAEEAYASASGDAKSTAAARLGVLRLCESNVWNTLGDPIEALHAFPDGLYSSGALKSKPGSHHSSGRILFNGVGDVWRARSVVLKALNHQLKAYAEAVMVGRDHVFDDEYDQARGAESTLRESFCASATTSHSQDDSLVDALVWLMKDTHGRPKLFAEARLLAVRFWLGFILVCTQYAP